VSQLTSDEATRDTALDWLWAAGYREWLPPAYLRASVACYWISVTPLGHGPAVASVMPDGCTDLIWQSGIGAFIAGPDTGPAPTRLPAGTVLVGVRFWPGAGGPALGVPLSELRDQRVDVADCLPRLAGQLSADLTPERALSVITAACHDFVAAGPPDNLVRHATNLLADGHTSVAGLCATLALSERQLRRRFDNAAGYGPKTMQRVLRFRKVLAQLTVAPQADLATLAVQIGYSDQAHLTRETRRLAGLTPSVLAQALRPAVTAAGPGPA
jgi:AraC-like DNA-binding protein